MPTERKTSNSLTKISQGQTSFNPPSHRRRQICCNPHKLSALWQPKKCNAIQTQFWAFVKTSNLVRKRSKVRVFALRVSSAAWITWGRLKRQSYPRWKATWIAWGPAFKIHIPLHHLKKSLFVTIYWTRWKNLTWGACKSSITSPWVWLCKLRWVLVWTDRLQILWASIQVHSDL